MKMVIEFFVQDSCWFWFKLRRLRFGRVFCKLIKALSSVMLLLGLVSV